MSQTVAYVRVSSADQNPERQLDSVRKFKPKKVFEEKLSGKDTNRPELQNMLEYVREGDTVIVHSLDRLARSLPDLRTIIETLNDKGVSVKFITNGLEFTAGKEADAMSVLMLNMLGAFAEFERTLIKERQREGIEKAKERGVYKGRTADMRKRAEIRALIEQGFSVRKTAEKLGCAAATVQKVRKEMKEEQENQ